MERTASDEAVRSDEDAEAMEARMSLIRSKRMRMKLRIYHQMIRACDMVFVPARPCGRASTTYNLMSKGVRGYILLLVLETISATGSTFTSFALTLWAWGTYGSFGVLAEVLAAFFI